MEGFNSIIPADPPAGHSTTASSSNPMSSEELLSPRPASTDRRLLRILEKSITEFTEKCSEEEIALILRLPEEDVEAMFTVWQAEQITWLSENWKNDWMRANVADANLHEAQGELEILEKKLESAREELQRMGELLEEKTYTERELEAQIRYLKELAGEGARRGVGASGPSLAERLKSSMGNRLGR